MGLYLLLHIPTMEPQNFKLDISADGWAGSTMYPIVTFDTQHSDSTNRSKVRIVSREDFKYQIPKDTILSDLNWKQGLNSDVEFTETDVEDFIQVQTDDHDKTFNKTLTHRPESRIASTRANRDTTKNNI